MPRRVDHAAWTADALEQVRQMTEAGHTAREIGIAIDRTTAAVLNIRVRYGFHAPINGRPVRATVRPVAEYRAPDGPTQAEVFAPAITADETDEEVLTRMLASSRKQVGKALAQRYATIRIPSAVPIAIALTSDWHIGTGCDLDALLALADYVAKTPNMYALAVGDLRDNPIKHRGGSVKVVADELRVQEIVVARFLMKLLGIASGNHDDWELVMSGVDSLAAMAKRHRIHFAPDEIIWRVEITAPHDPETVTAVYTIATRHQWRRHSSLNNTHACKTWLQEQVCNWEQIPDVLAIGHNHVSAIGSEQYEGRDVHYLRMGSFQKDSSYARAKGFADFRATAPTVVLPPTQGRIVSFADPQDAAHFLRGWRDVAA